MLSVVVVVVSGASHLRRCLLSLLQQTNPPGMEIIVPHAAYDSDIAALHQEFPAVRFHSVMRLADRPLQAPFRPHSHLDILRAEGIRAARGEIVALTEDHARVVADWAAGMVQAHATTDAAAVGGPIENEVNQALNWAVYFCDFGRYQSPVRTGETNIVSDVNISYKRSALESVREVWADFYHEPFVNAALRLNGAKLLMSSAPVLNQHREHLRLGTALQERFQWGRYYAANRIRTMSGWERAARILLSPLLPVVLVARMTQLVLQRQQRVGAFLRALPFFALLTLMWSFGEFAGYFAGNGDSEDSHARKLAFNFTYLSAGEVFSKVFSFLAFTLLARVLGPERFGSLEFTIALMVFFQLVVDLGSGSYGARGVAREPAAVDSFVASIVTMRAVLSVTGYALLALFAFLAVQDSEVRWLVLLYGLTLFASPGMLQWVFQGFDRMKPVALASVVRQSVFALLVLIIVRNAAQLRIIPFMELAAVAAVVACNQYLMRVLLPRVRFRWDLSGAVVAFRQTLPIGLSELTWACTWYFPTVLLALMVGGSPVGWFGAAQRPVMTLHGFVWLYFYNMLPSLSRAVARRMK